MLPVEIQDNRVHIGERFSLSLQRVERVDELTRPPVSRGQLPVRRLSAESLHNVNVVVPCDDEEAVWLGFCGENSRRVALKIRQGQLNSVTGSDWNESLNEPQDYLVTPDQTSWYGIRSSDGHILQFSRDPIELVVYEPTHPDDPPARRMSWDREFREDPRPTEAVSFSLVPDPKGINHWSVGLSGRVAIHFVDSSTWKSLTGETLPTRTDGYRGNLLP